MNPKPCTLGMVYALLLFLIFTDYSSWSSEIILTALIFFSVWTFAALKNKLFYHCHFLE